MGNAILDAALGLVLVYLVLSLLAMKVQELLDGTVLRGRVSNLHELVFQAVGRDEQLKQKVLKNPLIAALYTADEPARHTALRSKGPAAIPADLFARALLMELNDGKPPTEHFSTPSAFMAARQPQGDPKSPWPPALQGLLPGNEASWVGFEAAIASWFTDIGDRSEGWFKRRTQWWSLGVALFLAAGLNADSLHIATTLSADADLRAALADIGQRVDGQTKDSATAVPPPAALTAAPATVAVARLSDAIGALGDVARSDPGIGGFSAKDVPKELKQAIAVACPADAATGNLAPVDTRTWIYILPIVRTNVSVALVNPNGTERASAYGTAYKCLAHLSSWLGTAGSITTDLATKNKVVQVATAIEGSMAALRALQDQAAAKPSVRRQYVADPVEFVACAETADSRAGFNACVELSAARKVRLPLLPIASTLWPQFCKPVPGGATASAAWPCNIEAFAGNANLELKPMHLELKDWAWAQWFGGVFVTALFVALGAPFWFDLLGRVVKLRAAGTVRDAGAANQRADGGVEPVNRSSPPSAPAPGAPDTGPRGPGSGPFPDARNAFEDGMVARDVIALQQARGVISTGRLDQPTRVAIAAFCTEKGLPVTEELDRELFHAIVGRDAVQTPAAPVSASMRLNQVNAQLVPPVATRLMTALDFPARIPAAETRCTADLRALIVLYRYRSDSKLPHQRDVVTLARTKPEVLNEADHALVDEILKLPPGTAFPRSAAPWLDWAVGEIGQVERNEGSRANSNPRICEYLDTAVAGSGSSGDTTAWCGAFAAWVLRRHIGTLLPQLGSDAAPIAQLQPVSSPLRAANWASWGRSDRNPGTTGAAALLGAQPGDVVLFKPQGKDSSGHVAFFIEHDAASGHVFVLGGNQVGGSRVNITSFPDAQVVTVRF